MNLSVLKNNELVTKLDLSTEIKGTESTGITFFIGRAKHCHVFLDDMQISREHALLSFKNNEWFIKKNASFAELKLNGSEVNEAKLKSGDLVSIGQFILAFTIPEYLKEIPAEVVSSHEEKSEVKALDEVKEETKEEIQEPSTLTENATKTDSVGKLEVKTDATHTETQTEEGLGDVNLSGAFEEGQTQPSAAEGEVSLDSLPAEDGQQFPVEESAGEDGTRVVQSFAKIELELFGENAPYDRFAIESAETFIGRDDKKCQIILNDPEVSTVHAVIRKTRIGLGIEDLKSGNGTILNGGRINKAELTNNDEFIIGSTTFTVKITNDFVKKEENRLMPVEDNQVVEIEEVVEEVVDQNTEDQLKKEAELAQEKSFIKKIMKDPAKRKKAIIGAVLLMGVMLMLDDGGEQEEKTKKAKAGSKIAKEGEINKANPQKKKRSPEEEQFLEATYTLGQELFQTGKYPEALIELEKVKRVDPDYKSVKEMIELASEGLKKLEELEKKRQAEIERAERQKKVKELVEKAKEATKEKNITVAEALFSKISELDPENFDVPQLKMELDAWKKEQERIKVEAAQKEAERNRKVSLLAPSKTYYLKKDWYKAILKLEEFLKVKDMDEDLTKEATTMLEDSKNQLKEIVDPILGKARSLKEGQDLKGAYENYNQILQFDPANEEALNEMNIIRELLNTRSRRIYREAIISESLSLFDDAKEKLQEVQQISPSDSDYYKKATEKLKEYLD